MTKLLALLAVTALACCSVVRYDGHRVFRLDWDGANEHHRSVAKYLHETSQWTIDFWSEADIMVSSEQQTEVLQYLQANGIAYSVMVDDVQALIDSDAAQRNSSNSNDFFSDYHNLDDINAFINNLATSYPNLVTIEEIGKSYEKRASYAVTVRSNVTTGEIGIFFEGGIHAREWIAHTTVLYILNQLVTGYGKDANITKLVDAIEWTIVPVVNTDGYVYTWTNDRMWRKTRTPNAGSTCIGVDPNRNWDSHWCQIGASKDPCSDSYCGPSPFSDLVVANVANFIKTKRPNTKAFIDFHSYSQLWMTPYGYTSAKPHDYNDQAAMGKAAVAALKSKYGTVYEVGPIYTIVYPASGSSADWLYDSVGVKFPFGVELRDTGTYGFILPANQIIPSGEETFEAAKAMGNYLLSHQS